MKSNSLPSMYPALAALAKSFKSDLAALAGPQPSTIDLLSLRASCWWVAGSKERKNHAADPYGYLQTFDDFLVRFPETELDRKKFWAKINSPTGSSFLDTVGEAVMALHLRDQGCTIKLEVGFRLDSGRNRDADIVVVTAGGAGRIWADVVSIRPDEFPVPDGAFSPAAYAQSVVGLLSKRVNRKYESKFKQAVAAAVITDPVAIFICMLKCEEILAPLIPLQQLGLDPDLSAPPEIWANCPGLAVANIHRVGKHPGSDRLFPVWSKTWTQPAGE